MKVTIYFDMDGTIADLYSVDGWLEMLQAKDSLPYQVAEVMMNMSLLARYLNKLQRLGYKLGVISWLSKANDPEYNEAVTDAKLSWLEQHLPSVHWDEINIVSYGTPKQNFMTNEEDILFDDETPNRANWYGNAYSPDQILTVLKNLVKEA
jgi:hypothetical protein